MKAHYLAFLMFLIFEPAADAAEHQIDRYLASCMDAESTTAAMVNCTHQAYSLWDQELNIKYNNLMSVLAPADKQALRNAQRLWIAFRNEEFKAIDSLYSGKDGTMYIPMRALDRLALVKARVLQLSSYEHLVND